MDTLAEKKCLSCGKNIQGRADKKFCDDYCRNTYNNQVKSHHHQLFKDINAQLKKNRMLLAAKVKPGEETAKCPKKALLQDGYDFKYHTHTYTTKKGSTYQFCYDFGVLELEGEWILIVKNEDKKA